MNIHIQSNVSLAQLSTLGIGGPAAHYVIVASEDELAEAIDFAKTNDHNIHVLGDGTNTVFKDEGFDGLVIHNKITGFELDENGLLKVGAGENWDATVALAVDKDWSGIEALSLIPGTAGAAPVQNIGGYGQELSETFVSLRAYDVQAQSFVEMSKADCEFAYRSSKLKQHPGTYIVTQISLQLHHEHMQPPFYTTLERYFKQHGITDFTPQHVRDAVVAWRRSYLPDIAEHRTVGSFFVNPIMSKDELDVIIANHPSLSEKETAWYWQQPDGRYKVAAGRLAENVGLKDFHDKETGIATWKNSALILVNQNATDYEQLEQFRTKYLSKIKQAYGIVFEQEPVEV